MHRHKVFVSYHHANDQQYRDAFERLFAGHDGIIVSKSVQMGDIDQSLRAETVRQKIRDEYLRDSTVTVVLIGAETWKRKHVDWEIASSIRDTEYNPRSGLLGILLPTYPFPSPNKYSHFTIPPRLYDNIQCGFASIHLWSDDPAKVAGWIDAAYKRRKTVTPDNSYATFANNHSGNRWT